MTAATLAAQLIAVFEGCKLTAYRDTGGVLTIGFGHTGPDITPTTAWTQAQADTALMNDAAPLFKLVADKSPLAQAALVSFGYNCGAGTLKRVLASMDLPDGDAMKVRITDYIHDRSGNPLQGLAHRRALENSLYLVGMGD